MTYAIAMLVVGLVFGLGVLVGIRSQTNKIWASATTWLVSSIEAAQSRANVRFPTVLQREAARTAFILLREEVEKWQRRQP